MLERLANFESDFYKHISVLIHYEADFSAYIQIHVERTMCMHRSGGLNYRPWNFEDEILFKGGRM